MTTQYLITVEEDEGIVEVEAKVVTQTDEKGDPVAASRIGVWETDLDGSVPHDMQFMNFLIDGVAEQIYDDHLLNRR